MNRRGPLESVTAHLKERLDGTAASSDMTLLIFNAISLMHASTRCILTERCSELWMEKSPQAVIKRVRGEVRTSLTRSVGRGHGVCEW